MKSNNNNLDNYLQQLNTQQRAAVEYCDGPQLIVAGAGSGKTRVLTYKIVHLLHLGYKPYEILALTFTNKAAREMRDRIKILIGDELASKIWMGTFHSIFARILRFNASCIGYGSNFTIYDASDSVSLIKHIIKDYNLDVDTYKPSSVAAHISLCKNQLISPSDYARMPDRIQEDVRNNRPDLLRIYKAYWDRCKTADAMDFDDLLFNMNVLLRDNPDVKMKYQDFFKYVLIDEYQDTNFAQDILVYQLVQNHQHMSVVGDDAQSIYSFRGANINNILTLEKRYPGLRLFRLEQNYRSTKNITKAANSLIANNEGQIKKSLFSENKEGDKIKVIESVSDFEEAFVVANSILRIKRQQGCKYKDFAILYRNNALSRIIEKALSTGGLKNTHGNTRERIPYRIYGGTAFFQRKEVKDAVCYFRLVLNPNDDEALRRCIKYPSRGIGDATMAKVNACAVSSNVSLWQIISHPCLYGLNVNKGTLTKLGKFKDLIQDLISLNESGLNADECVKQIIEKTNLLSILEGDNTPENISRVENLKELLNSAHEFTVTRQEEYAFDSDLSLGSFLTEVALATDQDNDDSDDVVTLMTVHAAKGLEFKHIFIFGANEDIFPSYRSTDSKAGIEEERRLFYVAITRAEIGCTITYAKLVMQYGKTAPANPSRFLKEIDPKYIDYKEPNNASESQSGSMALWINPRQNATSNNSRSSLSVAPLQKEEKMKNNGIGGSYSIHDVKELSVGQMINHEKFGTGCIKSIDACENSKIIVEFEQLGIKTLLLKYAKFQLI